MPNHRHLPHCLLLLSLLAGSVRGADEPNGQLLYKAKCANCHGPQGEGTKKYRPRLEGDRSVAQLATVIQKTMPESSPGTLTHAEARAVAAYVHDAFYSPIARERNRPARVQLSRLTVRQYRQSVADLLGAFRTPAGNLGDARGLKAEYYRNRRFRPADRIVQRVDPQVAFDFGTDSPVGDKASPEEFSIRWNGSVLVPDTGEYEFLIRTEHAARLWINDLRRPLIDAWVKSGNDTEYRGSFFLIGGRSYSVRLEYSKAKQGVDDSNKKKGKPKPVKSSIALLWKPPHRVAEPIPSRHLAPVPSPELFVCTTPFPPDDRSLGWERGSAVSKEWNQAITEAALETAGYVTERLEELSGTREGRADRREKLIEFCFRLAERAFRRPLTPEQKASIVRQYSQGADTEASIKRVVLFVLSSPAFLYHEARSGTDGYATASRLALGLWDSLPDAELLREAAANRLATREQVARQVERMLADPRGRGKLRDFLLTWLKVDGSHDLARDPKRFPGFDAQAVSDLRSSLELFLDDVVWSNTSDFRQLLLSEEVFVNGRLAGLYGVNLPKDRDFEKVKLDGGKRAGILSHPFLMTSFAQGTESSPIHRGVFLARGVLGQSLRPPPEAVAPLAPSLHPSLTTRERVTLQTKPTSCMTCHGIINPLGFTLENFDAIGRYRAQDNGKPVDARGTYQGRDGKRVEVNGVRDLARYLVTSGEAHEAFAEQLFHYLVQQPVRAYGKDTMAELRRSFTENGFHVRKLAVEIMVRASLRR